MITASLRSLLAAAALSLAVAGPAPAQINQIDPNSAGDYRAPADAAPAPTNSYQSDTYDPYQSAPPAEEYTPVDQGGSYAAPAQRPADPPLTPPSDTLPREDVFSAAEGVFGKGAEGLAGLLENILKDQGEPVAYIAGQEAGGAFVVGVRYGSGTMRHRIEGDRPVYWTGPSIGFDAGADANKVFVLVYNLNDTQKLYRRYPAAEGRAYAVGGFAATYLRRGDVVLIPVRLGVGLRLGVNAGYMKFTEKTNWVPF